MWSNRVYEGENIVNIDATLDKIPVFVRAGKVLPMVEGTDLTLNVFPHAGSKDDYDRVVSKIYSDSGDGYGDWRLDEFQIDQSRNRVEIAWRSNGEFPLPYKRVYVVLRAESIRNILLDGGLKIIDGNTLETGVFQSLIFEIAPTRSGA